MMPSRIIIFNFKERHRQVVKRFCFRMPYSTNLFEEKLEIFFIVRRQACRRRP